MSLTIWFTVQEHQATMTDVNHDSRFIHKTWHLLDLGSFYGTLGFRVYTKGTVEMDFPLRIISRITVTKVDLRDVGL